MSRRIFVVHPTELTIASLRTAFQTHWTHARCFDFFDQSLYDELDTNGTITRKVQQHVFRTVQYCVESGADGIVFNGVTFGHAIDEARAHFAIPVVKPIEAMALEAVSFGKRIKLLCTSRRSIDVIVEEFEKVATGHKFEIDFVAGAQAALSAGDARTHDSLIAKAAIAAADCDVLAFAQAPMVSAVPLIPVRSGLTMTTTPGAAVRRLKQILENDPGLGARELPTASQDNVVSKQDMQIAGKGI